MRFIRRLKPKKPISYEYEHLEVYCQKCKFKLINPAYAKGIYSKKMYIGCPCGNVIIL